jgi:hypothetical protein
MLDLLAANDKKYYAMSTEYKTRDDIFKLLTSSFGDVGLSGSNDFFVLLDSKSFINGKPIRLSVIEITYDSGDDHDDVFTRQFRSLQKQIAVINH